MLIFCDVFLGHFNFQFVKSPNQKSFMKRCTIGHLSGNVQWSADGYAMGYTLEQIQSYCSKCSPMGDNRKGKVAAKFSIKNQEAS